MKAKRRKVLGQNSWTLRTSQVELAVTCQAGHLAPVRFRLGRRWVEPLEVAPWAEEVLPAGSPQVLRVMRGDFFCMPFGANATVWQGEKYPVHGETANARWRLEPAADHHLHVSLRTCIRRGRVDKHISLKPGHTAIYIRHVISGMRGPMCFGHHPILKVPEGVTARPSLSPFRFGQVFPEQLENPAQGGYSMLKPGAKFTSLKRVAQLDGGWADLSVWPARAGYEDLVQMAAESEEEFGWTALTVPSERYVWFALKDPRVLPSTVFWMSNGGRHYPPWSGRHRRVIGLEDVCANFHYGLAKSVKANAWTRSGVPTCVRLDPKRPLNVNYIMAMAEVPSGFDVVTHVKRSADRRTVLLVARSGRSVRVALDLTFLNPPHSQKL